MLALPLGVIVLPNNNWLLVTTGYNGVIVWNDIVWLRWIALVLCIVLADLGLGILRYCSLVCSSGVVVILLARRRVL
jgi:hypothetical protein